MMFVAASQFRNYLLDFERDYERMKERNDELESITNKHGSTTSKLESRCRSLEQKCSSLQQQLTEADKLRREFEAKVFISADCSVSKRNRDFVMYQGRYLLHQLDALS